ncbi:het domain protein [Colletotrichum truncatum]|uniref:Het domain protein n=1 Tax=Colletotrichum truncatum TaxID=5467 RepID=A0ACC3YRQ2_COLTU|nr:het domain protein [Colletotrichum truncatum]KAF6796594.1 het domain protein [Colletotrichum truncatum]
MSYSTNISGGIQQPREYDIVLLGATGFTGRFSAVHLSQAAKGRKWAISGRSSKKLTKLAGDLGCGVQGGPDTIPVDFTEESLGALARRTKCLIATVGPFPILGVLPFKACAENGTHYVDVNGETSSVLDMIRAYHSVAKSTGAVMIPSCGVGSLPADILTYLMVQSIREKFNTPTSAVLFSIHKSRVQASGGTLNSLVTSASLSGLKDMLASRKPWELSPVQPTTDRRTQSREVTKETINRLGLGTLGFGMSTTHDEALVQRTWGLFQQGESSGLGILSYGPNFNFKSVQRYQSRFHGWAFLALVWAMTILPAVFPPLRWLVRYFVPPGTGPTEEERRKNFLEYRGVAIADFDEHSLSGLPPTTSQMGVQATMRYDGDSYVFSGVLAAEVAMALLDLTTETAAHKLGGGVLTAAVLGQPLVDRLIKVGTKLDVSEL